VQYFSRIYVRVLVDVRAYMLGRELNHIADNNVSLGSYNVGLSSCSVYQTLIALIVDQ